MNSERIDENRTEAVRRRRKRNYRKMMEARLSAISLLVMVPVFLLIALFLLVWPRTKVSQIEKRELATFPNFSFQSYFDGEFTSGITKFYDDTVPFRDSFKVKGNQLKGLFGLRGKDSAPTIIGPGNVVAPPKPVDPQPSQTEAPTDPDNTGMAGRQPQDTKPTDPPTEEPTQRDYTGQEAEGNYENGLLIVNQDGHWRCMELFGGGSGTNYAEALNTLQEKLGSGVTIYSMPAPLASEFYVPSNFAEYSASQSQCFDGIAEKLNSGIVSINVCNTLSKHTEEPIYLRTDHHWQPLGAYYAAQAFAEAAGVPFADISEYEVGKNEGFVGTMYAFSGDDRLRNDPEDFTYYVPKASYKTHYYDLSFNYKYTGRLLQGVDTANSYLMFMGGDSNVVKIDTEVKNGRRLLIVKDSYGNAEVPFYTSSFEQVFVVDMRYFERNLVNFIKAMNITDVLFTMSSYSAVGSNANNIMNLIEQDASSQIVDGQLTAPEED